MQLRLITLETINKESGKLSTGMEYFVYLRRWQNMSIISNNDFTHNSREKSSNFQKRDTQIKIPDIL